MNRREVAVAKLSEFRSGELKEVESNGVKVLLARVGDKCFAVGANCTHYGASLVDGALVDERIVCPWHHACFDAATGDVLEPPALDSLPSYALRIDGDDILVEFTEEPTDRPSPERTEPVSGPDDRRFVILGAGAAGYMAAQTILESGFAGRVVMVTREDRTPYDRPNLSKDYLQGHAEPEWMPLRPEEFYEKNGIEILRQKEVTRIDREGKKLLFADGGELTYDRLLIATGGVPRKLDLPNSDLENIFLLRSFDDADSIIAAAESAKRAVVIGASFIGMEAACSLRERGLAVTVVAPGKTPFEKTLGAEIGGLFQKIHEERGVRFRLDTHVSGFAGDSKVNAVLLDSGESVEADLVIVGVGVTPATGFLDGIELHADGGVMTDRHLRVSDGIYAAGDIVHFPDARTGKSVRIEHWRTAMQQGKTAALNMLGKPAVYTAVPFFWTRQFDVTLLYVGHATKWDEIIYQGDLREQDFLAFFVKDHRVLAAAGMNRDREMAVFEELMRLNELPTPDRLRDGSFNFLEERRGAAVSI